MKFRIAILAGMLTLHAGSILAQEENSAQGENRARGVQPIDMGDWALKIMGVYPSAALRNAEQGTVHMRIVVGATGAVTDCQVLDSRGSEALDEAACSGMLKHARYLPARNKQGEIVSAVTEQSIRYSLPEGNSMPTTFMPPIPVEMDRWRNLVFDAEFERKMLESQNGTGQALYALTIDPDGNTTGCGVIQSSGIGELDNDACKSLLENARFEPSWVNGDSIYGFFPVAYPSYEALQNVGSQ